MAITYTQELKDYMERKGYRHIVVDQVDSKTCCAGFSELVTSFAPDKRAEEYRSKATRVLESEMGDIFVIPRGLEYDDDITFDLKNFLGAKDIEVKGIRVFSFS